jgi:hypothetical protein
MRSVDAATLSALQAGTPLVERVAVTLRVKTLAGVATTFGFWAGLEDVTLTVLSAATGLAEARAYHGGGLVEAGDIVETDDLTIHRVAVKLNPLNAAVADMARGHDCRLAGIDIHRVLLDAATRAVIGQPPLHFTGEVDALRFDTPAAGGEAVLTLDCVSASRGLTRTNPARRSDEHQKTRSGDRFMRYAGSVKNWQIVWGEK